MLAFDHIGVVVRDLSEGRRQIEATLPIVAVSPAYADEGLGVSVQFFRDASGVVFELIAPLGDASPVANTLGQSHRLNQLAYRCGDIEAAAVSLRRARAVPLGPPAPAVAFGGARVQFFWSPLGHVIELVETQEPRSDFVDTGSAAVE